VIDPHAQPESATIRRRALERRWVGIILAGLGFAAVVALVTGHEHLSRSISVWATLAGGAIGIVVARMMVAREEHVMVERARAAWSGRRGTPGS
jgi:hypothetical protein